MTVAVSVVICTLNRAPLVVRAVSSVVNQTLPSDAFEVVVVDNGSTDGTERAVLELARDAPNVRYVTEATRGLSFARNRGIEEARAPVVAFLDDDALAVPTWLASHLDAFADPDEPVATGGPIALLWPSGSRPRWLPEVCESLYSGLDLGPSVRALTFPDYPFGANMAVRREVLVELGGFPTWLGRRGRSLLSGEERELFWAIHRAGGRVLYVPDALVHHQVLPERARRRWLLRRSFDQGRSQVVVSGGTAVVRGRWWSLARASLHAARGVGGATGAVAALARRADDATVMRQAVKAAQWLGAAVQGARLAVRDPRSSGTAEG